MFSLDLGTHLANGVVAAAGTAPGEADPPAFLVIITVAVLVAFALRLTSKAAAPIGVIVKSLVAVGMAALVMLVAFGLVVFFSLSYL